MFITDPDLDFLPIPDPGSRGQKRHRIPDPQNCFCSPEQWTKTQHLSDWWTRSGATKVCLFWAGRLWETRACRWRNVSASRQISDAREDLAIFKENAARGSDTAVILQDVDQPRASTRWEWRPEPCQSPWKRWRRRCFTIPWLCRRGYFLLPNRE